MTSNVMRCFVVADQPIQEHMESLGQDLWEWIGLAANDYDDVDRMLIDLETIGG